MAFQHGPSVEKGYIIYLMRTLIYHFPSVRPTVYPWFRRGGEQSLSAGLGSKEGQRSQQRCWLSINRQRCDHRNTGGLYRVKMDGKNRAPTCRLTTDPYKPRHIDPKWAGFFYHSGPSLWSIVTERMFFNITMFEKSQVSSFSPGVSSFFFRKPQPFTHVRCRRRASLRENTSHIIARLRQH